MLKWITGLFFVCTSAVTFGCQIAITNLQMCDGQGVPTPWSYTSPSLGLRLSWTVTGAPAAPYSVKFVLADAAPIVLGPFNGAGSFASVCVTGYPSLFGLPVTVTIDPANVAGNTTPATAVAKQTFSATRPSTAIAYFGAQTLFGSQSMSVPINSGLAAKLAMLIGKPTSETSQTVVSDTSSGTVVTSQPTGYPVFENILTNVGPGTYSLSQSFQITASNVACNTALIHSTWADMDALKTTMAGYLSAEPLVNTADPKIIAFTNAALPANYRTTLTPLQTAVRLFGVVVRAITYKTPFVGDASSALQTKTGDCGGMTELYSACLRIVGIPCRMVAGWWLDKTTHVWSEIFFPGAGWFPADASLSRKTSVTCAYLPFFGFAPSANQRCTVCRTGTLNTPDISTAFVQTGAWTWSTTTANSTAGPMTSTLALSTTPLP